MSIKNPSCSFPTFVLLNMIIFWQVFFFLKKGLFIVKVKKKQAKSLQPKIINMGSVSVENVLKEKAE